MGKVRRSALRDLVVYYAGVLLILAVFGYTFLSDRSLEQPPSVVGKISTNPAVEKRIKEYNRKVALGEVKPGDGDAYRWYLDIAKMANQTNSSSGSSGEVSPFGYLRIDSINVGLPIYLGTGEYAISHGVGHLFGTALPDGSGNGRPVFSSHSGMVSATLFDNLPRVKVGDLVWLYVPFTALAYRVDRVEVILPDEVGKVRPVGRDEVSFLTCYPFGRNTHRFLVTAKRDKVMEARFFPVRSAERVRSSVDWFRLGLFLGVGFAVLVFPVAIKQTKKWRS